MKSQRVESDVKLMIDDFSSIPYAIRHTRRFAPRAGSPLPVEELPEHAARVLLVGAPGSGKSLALRQIATARASTRGTAKTALARLDGAASLTSLAEAALPDGLLLVDGVERLDPVQRDIALGELRELYARYPELTSIVAVRPEDLPLDLPGSLLGLRSLDSSQIVTRLIEVAGPALTRKALTESESIVLDLGRRPLYLDILIEVLIGYGNLPPRRSLLMSALIDLRIDREVAAGGAGEERSWQISEPLGKLALDLVLAPTSTHRMTRDTVLAAFAEARRAQGMKGATGEDEGAVGEIELALATRAGILVRDAGETLHFSSSEFESFFAGMELARRIELSGDVALAPASDPRAADAIVNAASMLDDATQLVQHALKEGGDLLCARCLVAAGITDIASVIRDFETRLASGLSPRAAPQVRESILEALAILGTPAARVLITDAIRREVSPPARIGRQQTEIPYQEILDRVPERLAPFVHALSAAPPSRIKEIAVDLARTRFEHEFVAAAHLLRLLDIDLDQTILDAFMDFVARSQGNRPLHELYDALGIAVVERALPLLLEDARVAVNPFSLGRLLRASLTPRAAEHIQDALESPDERIRQLGTFVLSAHGDPLALGEIEAASTSGHGQRRWFAAAALEGVLTDSARTILKRLANDRDAEVRNQARSSLATCKQLAARAELGPFIDALVAEPTTENAGALVAAAEARGSIAMLGRLLDGLGDRQGAAISRWLAPLIASEPERARALIGQMRMNLIEPALAIGDTAARAIESGVLEGKGVSADAIHLARELALAQSIIAELFAGDTESESRGSLGADHGLISRAILAMAARIERQEPTPIAGAILVKRLCAAPGTLAEALRRLVLKNELTGAPLRWALASLEDLGGGIEILRMVADSLYEHGAADELRAELEAHKVAPRRPSLPDPLLSVAARRALSWFGRARPRRKSRPAETDVEVRIDPFPYLWFRRQARAEERAELGGTLARIIGEDADHERRERNLESVRQLDGGLLEKVRRAAGLPPAEPKPRKKKGKKGAEESGRDSGGESGGERGSESDRPRSRRRRDAEAPAGEANETSAAANDLATAPVAVDLALAMESASEQIHVDSTGGTELLEHVTHESSGAVPPPARPAPQSSERPPQPQPRVAAQSGRSAPSSGRPPHTQSRSGPNQGGRGSHPHSRSTPQPARAAAPTAAAPPKNAGPPRLVDTLALWWSQRTSAEPYGVGARRRGKKQSGTKIRPILDQLLAGVELEGARDPGTLSAILALTPSEEESRKLLSIPGLGDAIRADVDRSSSRAWHREAARRVATV